MFDTYYSQPVNRDHYHTSNVEIIEKRAPTDESLKLLEEMHEKVVENILYSGTISDNSLNAVWEVYQNYMTCNIEAAVRIKLNGKERIVHLKLPFHCHSFEDRVEYIYEEICKELAKDILQPFYKSLRTNN
jgi:hypothetical protein